MLDASKITKKIIYHKIKKPIEDRNIQNRFIQFLLNDNKSDFTCLEIGKTTHTIKSLDGYDIHAYEKLIDVNNDFVLIVSNDINEIFEINQLFNDSNLNTITLEINNNLNDNSKAYLNVLCFIDYFKKIYPNKKFYLYGYQIGANIITEVLKTNVNKSINAVVLNNVETSLLENKFKYFFTINSYQCNLKIIDNVKKVLLNKHNIDINLLDKPELNLKENLIPIIFISKLTKVDKNYLKFLSIYNSTKGIKKILIIDKNNYQKNLINNFYKIIEELRKH